MPFTKRSLCLTLAISGLLLTVSALTHAATSDELENASVKTEESSATGAKLTWSKNFSESLERAKKENKLVLVDMYTTWCGWCKVLDKTTFTDPDFVAFADEKFVMVKLDAQDNGEGTKLAQQLSVSGYPTGLVFDRDGNFISKVFGYKPAPQYKKALQDIIKKAK